MHRLGARAGAIVAHTRAGMRALFANAQRLRYPFWGLADGSAHIWIRFTETHIWKVVSGRQPPRFGSSATPHVRARE